MIAGERWWAVPTLRLFREDPRIQGRFGMEGRGPAPISTRSTDP
jgi:hypothetical protein